jgi:hypothetical protein
LLIIDVQKVRVLDRGRPSVLMSSEHADNFTRNLLTILTELHVGLAVFDSGAVGLVELPNNSSPQWFQARSRATPCVVSCMWCAGEPNGAAASNL